MAVPRHSGTDVDEMAIHLVVAGPIADMADCGTAHRLSIPNFNVGDRLAWLKNPGSAPGKSQADSEFSVPCQLLENAPHGREGNRGIQEQVPVPHYPSVSPDKRR